MADVQPAVIAIMGSTGAGKSLFINTLTKSKRLAVGDGLDSCTKEVQEVHLKWGKEQKAVVLVDTPGLGYTDVNMTDAKVFRSIQKHFADSHRGTKLTGIIFMHRISDTKVEGERRDTFRTFRKLCRSEDLQRIVIVTTWWDKVDMAVAAPREVQLRNKNNLFKPMLDFGAQMMRHEMRHDQGLSSAREVLDHLLRLNTTHLQIETQPLQDGVPLKQRNEQFWLAKLLSKIGLFSR